MALGHWHRCILRTIRARHLVRIKHHKSKRMLKAWRGLVGDELASIVVDQVLDEFADEKMQQHVNRYFGDYVKSTGLRFEMLANDGVEKCVEPIVELTVESIIDEFCSYDDLPAWMDQNWFLQKCSYENHLLLVRAGTAFRLVRRIQKGLYGRNATIIQRACRGRMGRDRVRQKLARTYRKRRDGRFQRDLKTDGFGERRAHRMPRGAHFPGIKLEAPAHAVANTEHTLGDQRRRPKRLRLRFRPRPRRRPSRLGTGASTRRRGASTGLRGATCGIEADAASGRRFAISADLHQGPHHEPEVHHRSRREIAVFTRRLMGHAPPSICLRSSTRSSTPHWSARLLRRTPGSRLTPGAAADATP